MNKTFKTIVGLGDTGLSCARYLYHREIPFAVTDNRETPPHLAQFQAEFPNIELETGAFSERLLDKADEIVLSPGVSLQEKPIQKQAQKGKRIIGDIELFAREIKKPIVAITGSNGKTTVTTLMGLMMQANKIPSIVCGNIGNPVLDYVDRPDIHAYVMELSSFQLETTYSLQNHYATVLNVTPDHLDRYADLEEYKNAKLRIYQGCKKAIVNADEPDLWKSLSFTEKPITFGLNPDSKSDFSLIKERQKLYLAHQNRPILAVDDLKLKAPHHLQNALATLALGYAAQLSLDPMLQVLRDFSGLPHRCQWIRNFHNVDFYNDSKGTNVGATEAAINSLGKTISGKIILIAGGQGKGGDFSYLSHCVKQYVRHLVLIGEDGPLLKKNLSQFVPISDASSMEEAVYQAVRAARSGDIVLLSPACASFDMFNNYEHRGEVFTRAVEALS